MSLVGDGGNGFMRESPEGREKGKEGTVVFKMKADLESWGR